MHSHSDVIYPVAFFFGLILTLTWYGASLGRLKRRMFSLEQRVSELEMAKLKANPRSRVHPEQVGVTPPAKKRVRKPKPSISELPPRNPQIGD